MFAPEVRVHFRGDSIRVDWILSLEPFQSMLRIDGQPAMGAAVPEHLHLAVLDLVRQVYPSDSLLSYRYGVETERHRGDAAETEAKDEGAWAESDAAWQEDAAGCLSIIEDPPTPVTQVKPTYPEFAKDAQIEGRVILHVLVGKDGRVKTIKLIRGVTGLNEAAVDAVRRWVFKPGLKAGEPVCVWVEVPVDFHL
jgi:protein TonB